MAVDPELPLTYIADWPLGTDISADVLDANIYVGVNNRLNAEARNKRHELSLLDISEL